MTTNHEIPDDDLAVMFDAMSSKRLPGAMIDHAKDDCDGGASQWMHYTGNQADDIDPIRPSSTGKLSTEELMSFVMGKMKAHLYTYGTPYYSWSDHIDED